MLTINDIAAELAGTYHGTVIILMESRRQPNLMHFMSNLREAASLHQCQVASTRDVTHVEFRKRSGAAVSCHIKCQRTMEPHELKGFRRDTPVFTETRAGWAHGPLGHV
jgi:hypothetical protein